MPSQRTIYIQCDQNLTNEDKEEVEKLTEEYLPGTKVYTEAERKKVPKDEGKEYSNCTRLSSTMARSLGTGHTSNSELSTS